MSQLRPLSGPLVALALGAVTAALPAGGAQTQVAGPFATQLRQSEAFAPIFIRKARDE